MVDLVSRLRIMCQCGQPSYVGTPIKPPCWACEAQARIRELEAALRRYGTHENGCPMWVRGPVAGASCTCGFEAMTSDAEVGK